MACEAFLKCDFRGSRRVRKINLFKPQGLRPRRGQGGLKELFSKPPGFLLNPGGGGEERKLFKKALF